MGEQSRQRTFPLVLRIQQTLVGNTSSYFSLYVESRTRTYAYVSTFCGPVSLHTITIEEDVGILMLYSPLHFGIFAHAQIKLSLYSMKTPAPASFTHCQPDPNFTILPITIVKYVSTFGLQMAATRLSTAFSTTTGGAFTTRMIPDTIVGRQQTRFFATISFPLDGTDSCPTESKIISA